jgi:hypothetical protein
MPRLSLRALFKGVIRATLLLPVRSDYQYFAGTNRLRAAVGIIRPSVGVRRRKSHGFQLTGLTCSL